MGTENDTENLTAEQQAEQDEAAFNEGFDGEQPAEQIVTVTETESDPESDSTTDNDSDNNDELAAPVLAGMTEPEIKILLSRMGEIDELKQNLKTLQDRTFGTLGDYNARLQDLQKTRHTAAVSIKGEQLTRLHEFEPELAELLAEDLSESFGAGNGGVDEDLIKSIADSAITDATNALSSTYEKKLLTFAHPDYQNILSTQEWGAWLGTQDEQTRSTVLNSIDALETADVITRFKDWRTTAERSQQEKQTRLESAILPTGDTVVPADNTVSDEEAFLAGFKSA